MTLGTMQRVMPMIAKIEDDDFVAIAQRSPEWKVAVNRKSVAVTEHEARRVRDAVLPDVDNRAVVHLHVEGVTSARHMMYRRSFVHRVMLTAS
jgi:prophage tail gpP-like protein